jgi:hypothetical protein
MNKKLKRLIVISLVIFLIAGAGVVLKNIFLNQVKNKIQSALGYTQLRLSLFPPALIMDDVRTISPSPFFSAKKVSVKISYRSLLTREKPLNVFIDEPVLVIHAATSAETKRGETKAIFPIPFAVERGLIRGGELYYWGKGNNFCSLGIKALFTQKKDFISFQGEAEENIFSLGSSKKELRGKLNLSFEGRGDEIVIRKMRMNGPDFIMKAEGNLINLREPEIALTTFLRIKTPLIVDFLDLPFEWDGKAEGTGILTRKEGEISFSSSFFGDDIHLNKVPLGKVNGRVEIRGTAGGNVEFNIRKGLLPREYIKIYYDKKKVSGVARGFHLDPIMKYTHLPWPVISPVWGDFTIEEGVLKVDAEFRDESLQTFPDKFPFHGRFKFNYDLEDELTFFSEKLLTSFADVGVEGKVKLNDKVDVKIQGEVSDIKRARQFTSLILNKKFEFPEIRGKGSADLQIIGDYGFPQIRAKFSLSPGGFAKFQVDSVEGQAEIIKQDFFGKFQVEDPFMRGKIDLITNQLGVRADVHLDQGNVEKILPALDIDLPLSGKGSGDFRVRQQGEDVQVNGEFSSSSMKFSGQNMKNVSGKLVWEDNVVTFPELQFSFYEGEVKGYAQIGVLSEFFDLDVIGNDLNIAFFNPGLKGSLSFGLKGKGFFGKDRAPGKFEVMDLLIYPFQKTEAKGDVKLGIRKDSFDLELEGNFFPGENEFHVSLHLPFFQEPLSANIRGSFRNLDLLLPWRGAKGQINYLADLNGGKPSWQLKGVIDFKGSVFPLPKFAHAVRDYSGLVFVENTSFSIRSFKGVLGGGDVWGSGGVKLGKKGVEKVELKAQGKNLLLSPLERTRVLGDGSLKLIKDENRFDLEGDFLIQKLTWRRELNEKFVFYSTPYYLSRTEPGIFDDLNLNLRLQAKDNAWMENSLGRIEGKFDLAVAGNVKAPILTGDIEALQGNVYFQDRKFRILSGRVSFINPSTIEPYLEFKGETHVKDYRVTFSLNGLIDRLNPEFSSSPPLPPEDVLALLAMGEAFKRTYSYDRSTQLSTASLLSFQLAEEAKKRAEKLFRFDRFRIDPFLMGSSAETTARLTVGKKISRNFFILYSTSLSTQREELVRLEWELTDDFSVVGIRDEKGRFSFDVKIHKRF